jgi:small GTP-binding protein
MIEEEKIDENELEEDKFIQKIEKLSDFQEEHKYLFRVCLLGDAGVGKTSLLTRFCDNYFFENYNNTIGIDFRVATLKYDNIISKIHIWDTAGQERFRSLGKNFYKDAYIVLLVYDITRLESFENLKNIWYQELKENGEQNPIIAIVGNKSDLYEEEEIVKEEDARNYAKEIGALFNLVSAKNGLGIENLFNDILDAYLKNNYPEKIEKINQARKVSVRLDKKNHSDSENKDQEGGEKPSGRSGNKKKKCC